MAFAALTFALVVVIVLGTYWALIERPARAAELALRRRLGAAKAGARVSSSVQSEARRLSSLPALEQLLARRMNLTGPIVRLIDQSGLKTTVGVVLLSAGCLFMLGLLVGQTWSGSLQVGLVLGACLAAAPVLFLRYKGARRVRRFEELFPEALDLMTRALRAGHTFAAALGMVADELPEPIAAEFKLLHDQQNFGMPLPEALRSFGERVPLLAAKFFVTAILTQRESGGNLTEVLTNLASVIRDRFMVKRQVQVRSAHGRVTGWILMGLPPALAVVFSIINPKHFAAMLDERLGIQMIVGAVVFQVVGALVIRKIVNVDY
ncbi:MAG TPA: type II secretion system F family protein [Vicinamibacterales bacterium]|nr:type II secretion system F family protein [Vicinamibacterales bacterium]HPW19182.1 type II secretion system F family protein [Vicinamibacterales bacterium]